MNIGRSGVAAKTGRIYGVIETLFIITERMANHPAVL